jgi:hypothetical protein
MGATKVVEDPEDGVFLDLDLARQALHRLRLRVHRLSLRAQRSLNPLHGSLEPRGQVMRELLESFDELVIAAELAFDPLEKVAILHNVHCLRPTVVSGPPNVTIQPRLSNDSTT